MRHNDGTGYGWTYKTSGSTGVKLYSTTASQPTSLGGEVSTTWTFECTSAGSVSLACRLARSWDTRKPDQTARYSVKIEK